MIVKVGDEVHKVEYGKPIMVYLTDHDRNYITKEMHKDAHCYAVFADDDPEFQDKDKMFEWMKIEGV